MRSENEIQQISDCVKKQVKIVKNSLVSNDCPRLSVRPGSNTYTGLIQGSWHGGRRIPWKPKTQIDDELSSSNLWYGKSKSKPQRLWLSGFFQAQLRKMKSSKHQRKISSTSSPILKKHRKMLDGRRIHDLPMELVAEILKRLPVKYILRCRGVQKSWHSLIQSHFFITLQLNYQKNNIITTTTASHHLYKYLFFDVSLPIKLAVRFDDVQCREYCKIQLPPSLPKYAWFAASYGLVCVSSALKLDTVDYNRNIYLWNPLIQKYKMLPESPLPSNRDEEEWADLAFGFVPEVNDWFTLSSLVCTPPPTPSSLVFIV
ncbi:hypothetical protein POM88_037722 [Heracleum sosnowskyi]|uniref:F-box domain-containing protein n=1 Tax=Heracleum sosnowskyi TaxID=360622 RepID=A0AAD8HQR0_9APIA|nr:hypothetical protein POM88_037722 [Heracleum sosnowskyi]